MRRPGKLRASLRPLIGALRPLVRDGDPALDALPAQARADLGTLLPGLADGPDDAEPSAARVFDALLALLEALGAESPVLLVIEDMHWADGSTRAFVSYLVRMFCGERLLVVGTYRTDELHRRHPLRPLLAELTRDPGSRHVELAPFTREEMATQLGDILGHEPEPSLVERLHARSGGNALFTEELLASGLDGRGGLPPTLRDALMLRVEGLSAESQELLRWLACQQLDDELLAELSGVAGRELSAALREAVTSHIVVARDRAYDFRHALLREVVYDNLLPGERTHLHAAIAAALERRLERDGADPHNTAEIAYHLLEAGDQPAALRASVRAARAAHHVHAWPEAAGLYERALELWERVPEPESLTEFDRIELLALAAHAADLAGDAARQETLLERALELLDEEVEPRRAAALLERLHRAQWSLNRQDRSVETLDRALVLLEPDEETTERAALLAAKARARMLQGRHAQAIAVGEEALAVAGAAGDRQIQARTLSALGVALFCSGDVDAGTHILRDGIEVARELDLLYELQTLYVNLADLLHLSGRSDEALAVIGEGLEVRGQGQDPAAAWVWLQRSEIHFDLGDWDAAMEDIPRLERGNADTTLLNQRLRRAEVLLARGDLDAAREQVEGAERVGRGSTEPQFLGVLGTQRAELELRAGNFDAARRAVDDALDRIEFCTEDVARISRLARIGATIEANAAQHARDRRDDAAEAVATERADLFLERAHAAALGGRLVEAAQAAVAEAEHARAHDRDDVELWRRAAAAWRAVGRPYPIAYTRWRAAEALVRADDRDGAATEAAEALRAARALGSGWLAAEVESLAARARLRLPGEPASRAANGAPAAPDANADGDPFGLTARERQVLALVAQGCTNREIGIELHMAEKTASVHVSRILAKLDVRSRTEAAGVAHRHGLAGSGAPAV